MEITNKIIIRQVLKYDVIGYKEFIIYFHHDYDLTPLFGFYRDEDSNEDNYFQKIATGNFSKRMKKWLPY